MTNFPIHCLPTPKIIDDGPIRLSHLLCFANPTPPSSSSSLLEQVHVQWARTSAGDSTARRRASPCPAPGIRRLPGRSAARPATNGKCLGCRTSAGSLGTLSRPQGRGPDSLRTGRRTARRGRTSRRSLPPAAPKEAPRGARCRGAPPAAPAPRVALRGPIPVQGVGGTSWPWLAPSPASAQSRSLLPGAKAPRAMPHGAARTGRLALRARYAVRIGGRQKHSAGFTGMCYVLTSWQSLFACCILGL